MVNLLIISLGGALGSVLRYLMSGLVQRSFASAFPYGTLSVNLIGSLLIGFLWGLSEEMIPSAAMRLFIFVGMLGAFTTFSTFSLETLNLMRDGQIKFALMNVLVSNILGIALAFAGFSLARQFILK